MNTSAPRSAHQGSQANGVGPSDEHLAFVAARRAFVEMKAAFLRAALDVPGATGLALQRQVQQACEAIELWRLRESLFMALPAGGQDIHSHRLELHRQLDTVFPDLADSPSFAAPQ
jgi:hypothetical protein